ncbi:MmcQ/YjbR family DNA-binding protein [Streptomyces canus]|uniref:MmcQ/YjbR family DNA-binding protein n=1 Tax=Streptomyces canus TaxID=58343 RepID=UPI00370FDC2A
MPVNPVTALVASGARSRSAALRRREGAEITPGYHMNKRHWITLEGGNTIDETLVKELAAPDPRPGHCQPLTGCDGRGGGPGAGFR